MSKTIFRFYALNLVTLQDSPDSFSLELGGGGFVWGEEPEILRLWNLTTMPREVLFFHFPISD